MVDLHAKIYRIVMSIAVIALCIMLFPLVVLASYSGLPEEYAFDGVMHTLHESGIGYVLYYHAEDFTVIPLKDADRFALKGSDDVVYADISRVDLSPDPAHRRALEELKSTFDYIQGSGLRTKRAIEAYGISAAGADGRLAKIYIIDSLDGGALIIDLRLSADKQQSFGDQLNALISRFLPMPSLRLYNPQ